jgi:transcriptional regulator with XRE-family HTH domain
VPGWDKPADGGRAARDRFAANLSRLIERGGFDVEAIARRSGLDPETVRNILRGEDLDPPITACVALAGAAGGTFSDLTAGIAWIPDYEHGSGQWKVDSID